MTNPMQPPRNPFRRLRRGRFENALGGRAPGTKPVSLIEPLKKRRRKRRPFEFNPEAGEFEANEAILRDAGYSYDPDTLGRLGQGTWTDTQGEVLYPAGHEKLLQQARQPKPQPGFRNPLAEKSLQERLGEAAESLLATRKAQPKQNVPEQLTGEGSNRLASARSAHDLLSQATPPQTRPAPPLPGPKPAVPKVPAYRNDVFNNQPGVWKDWAQATQSLPNVGKSETFAYRQIFAAEGGTTSDPKSGRVAGVNADNVNRAIESGALSGVKKGTPPQQLGPQELAIVYREHFNDVLRTIDRTVPGSKTLEALGDKETAAAFADTLFRHGRGAGAGMVQRAINTVDPGAVSVDGKIGPKSAAAYARLAGTGSDKRRALLDALAKERIQAISGQPGEKGERVRIDYFRFQNPSGGTGSLKSSTNRQRPSP